MLSYISSIITGDPKQPPPPTKDHYHDRKTSKDLSVSGARHAYEGHSDTTSNEHWHSRSEITMERDDTRKRCRNSSQPAKMKETDVKAVLQNLIDDLRTQQAKYSNLREKNSQMEEDITKLEDDHRFYSQRYRFVVCKYIQPNGQQLGLDFDDRDGSSIEMLMDSFLYNAIDADSLCGNVQTLKQENLTIRSQVQKLQTEMLARVEKVQAVSDEKFAQYFRTLVSAIKSLSRMIQFLDQVDVVERLGSPILLDGVPPHHWESRPRKKIFVEAYIWSILIYKVFRSPFNIFGADNASLSQMWTTLFGVKYWYQWPVPTPRSETWRHTTVEHLVEMAGRDYISYGTSKEYAESDEGKTLRKNIDEARENVVNHIQSGLASISMAYDVSHIRQIVKGAFAMSMQMSLQRSRVQITFPPIGYPFTEGAMSSVSDPDGKDLEDGTVAFIVNPGLTKWGDAHGKNLDQKFDITPSLVRLDVVITVPALKQTYSKIPKRDF